MFAPSQLHRRVIELCKAREERNGIVFNLVRPGGIDMIPEGTLFFLPGYRLCPGRELPKLQAVSTGSVFMATDSVDEYVVFSAHAIALIVNGLEDYDYNFANTHRELDAGEEYGHYALVIPHIDFEFVDLAVGPKKAPPKVWSPVARPKLEFI